MDTWWVESREVVHANGRECWPRNCQTLSALFSNDSDRQKDKRRVTSETMIRLHVGRCVRANLHVELQPANCTGTVCYSVSVKCVTSWFEHGSTNLQ